MVAVVVVLNGCGIVGGDSAYALNSAITIVTVTVIAIAMVIVIVVIATTSPVGKLICVLPCFACSGIRFAAGG